MTDYTQMLSVYSEETRAVLTKIREELNSDTIFSKLEEQYNVYDLLTFNEFNIQALICTPVSAVDIKS